MTETDTHCFENAAIEADVQSMMEEYKELLPKWLNTLSVVSSSMESEGNALKCHYGMHEYMHARISVFPPYFDQGEERRRIGLIHEHVHLQHADLLDFAEKHLIEPIRERNPELHAFVDEEFRVKLERFTESIAIGIYKAIEGAKASKAVEPSRPIESDSTCRHCAGPLGANTAAGPRGLVCGQCHAAFYQPYTGVSAIGSPNTSWVPETPCEDCGQPIGPNKSHPQITRPLCPVHRDLELIVPKKGTP